MELIVGGSGQGKLDCALRHMRAAGCPHPLIVDAARAARQEEHLLSEAELRQAQRAGCIVGNLQELTRREPSPERLRALTEHLAGQLRHCIFLCEEIGCGVVPLEREERQWRERTGRLCCVLAERAGGVTRVICGMEQFLPIEKEEAGEPARAGGADQPEAEDRTGRAKAGGQ